MKITRNLVPATVLVLVATGIVSASPATAAEPCVSGAEVRAQVHELVASMRDDVQSRAARRATKRALVEAMRTYRGARADTADERNALGQQIAALARRQSDPATRVEGRALALAIVALTEQRERGPRFTENERDDLTAAKTRLRRAAVAQTSNGVEGQKVAAAFKALHTQFTCTPD